MRTFMLLAVAAAAAWLANDAQAQQVTGRDVRVERRVVIIHPVDGLNNLDTRVYPDGAAAQRTSVVQTSRSVDPSSTGGTVVVHRSLADHAPDRTAHPWNDEEMLRRCGAGGGAAPAGANAAGCAEWWAVHAQGYTPEVGAATEVADNTVRTDGTVMAAPGAVPYAGPGQLVYGGIPGGMVLYQGVPGQMLYGPATIANYAAMQTGGGIIVEETETTYETVAIPARAVRARVAARPRARARPAARPAAAPRCTCACTPVCR